MDLHTAGHHRGVACAPHSAAAEAGRAIFAEGGNALEAMVAMAATIAAVYPHMNHIGGDGFWLVREPSGRVRALMAPGPAGSKATPALYRDHGYDEIPTRGPLSALTVPGAVGGWILALEAAKSLGGKLPLDVLLSAAIRHARDGYTVTRSQEALSVEKLVEVKDAPGFAATFLPDGKPPKTGDVLKQSALAATLDQLAQAGLADFYKGDVGREIAADLARIDSPVTRADLEKYSASVEEPLSVTLQSGTIYNAPPPTQGLASLIILALYDRLRVSEAESFDHIHGLVEATKRAFRVRDRVIADPARMTTPSQNFLENSFADAQAEKIDRRKAAPWPARPGDGDTIWMGAADGKGLVVSYIQSIYWEFGSACVLPATGVLMQNRGASFSLDPRALNTLAPGRLPFHTLNPALAVLKDGRVMAYGTMGGEGQPQSQAAVFTRHVLYRQPLDVALDAPRWLLGRTWGSTITNLRVESRFDGHLIDRLLSAGHDVDVLTDGYSDTMGHAGAAILHPDGMLEAAHDPRADGGAAGL
jgi:gamma-glutamyltranspeptidase